MTQKPSPLLIFLILALTGIVIYLPVLSGEFCFDDYYGIVDNALIKNLSHWPELWSHDKSRFLAYFSFALNYHLHGLNAGLYHLTNILIHIASSWLVYILVSLLARTPRGRTDLSAGQAQLLALSAAMLFMVHPAQTQAVAYIVQRISSMVALFYLGSLAAYAGGRVYQKRPLIVLAWVLCVCAMLTKETAFTLPLAMILMEAVFFGFSSAQCRGQIVRLLPFVATMPLVPILVATGFVQTGHVPSMTMETAQIGRWDYFLTQLHVLGTYVCLLLFPMRQNADYDYSIVHSLGQGTTLLLLMCWGLLLLLAWYERRRNRWFAFGIFFFFLTLSVESSVIPIKDVIQEHRLYLPMAGFAVIVGDLFRRMAHRRVAGFLMGVLFVALALLTYHRSFVWQNEIRLWQDVITQSPLKARGYDNLGSAHLRRGNLVPARYYLNMALMFSSGTAETYVNLGTVALKEEKDEESERYFQAALFKDPSSAMALNGLGILSMHRGNDNEAEDIFEHVIALDGELLEPRLNLAEIDLKRKDYGLAERLCDDNLKLDPRHESTWFVLAKVYLLSGRTDALLQKQEMVFSFLRDDQYLLTLGAMAVERNLFPLAQRFYLKVILEGKDKVPAFRELGKIYGNFDRFDAAIQLWREGQRMDPTGKDWDVLIRQAEDLKRGVTH